MFCFPNLCFFQLPYTFIVKNNRRKPYRSTQSVRLAVKTKLLSSLAFKQLDPGRPRGPPYLHWGLFWHKKTSRSFCEARVVTWCGRYGLLVPCELGYEQSLFFLGLSSKKPETCKWARAWLNARDERGTTTLARACTPLTKAVEKERLFAVYLRADFLSVYNYAIDKPRETTL